MKLGLKNIKMFVTSYIDDPLSRDFEETKSKVKTKQIER